MKKVPMSAPGITAPSAGCRPSHSGDKPVDVAPPAWDDPHKTHYCIIWTLSLSGQKYY